MKYVNIEDDIVIENPKSGGIILTIDGHEFGMDGETAESIGVMLIKASIDTHGSDE